MELTTQQIQFVEKYLETKNFDFIDLKPEILDHVVSDIEEKMRNNIAFENAYKMTILKWEKYFRETSSFFFGFTYSESKIVIKNAIKMFKPFYFIYLAAYILPMAFLKLFPISFNENTIGFINGFLMSTAICALSYLAFIFIKMITSKVKTTARFIMKTQYFASVFLVFGVFLGNIFNKQGELNPVFTGFVCAGFSVVFICHHFFKKHQKAVANNKIV